MSSIFNELVLPSYVRADLAFQDELMVGDIVPAVTTLETVIGEFWEKPLTLFFQLKTDGTVGARDVFFRVEDQDGFSVYDVSPLDAQPENSTYTYAWTSSVTTSVATANAVYINAMPPFVVPPGWSWGIALNGLGAGDEILGLCFVRVKYPTGPPLSVSPQQSLASQQPIPTPLLV